MRNPLLLVPVLLILSCAPMMGLQSGRSLGKGNAIITPYIQTGDIYVAPDTPQIKSLFLVGAGAQFSTGVTERLDIGGKVDFSSFIVFQTKYQILGNQISNFAVSLAAEGGILPAAWLVGDAKFYYYQFPLFLSYHPTERICFYAKPFYSFGRISRPGKFYGKDSSLVDGIITNERFAFSYGFSIGRKNKLSIEIGHYDAQVYRPTQAAVSYTFWLSEN